MNRHEVLARLTRAATEFLETVVPERPEIAALRMGSILIDGVFREGVEAQVRAVDVDARLAAVAEYASAFDVPVRFEDLDGSDTCVWVATVGVIAGERVQVWTTITRKYAHQLATQWKRVPVLNEVAPAVVVDTLVSTLGGVA